MDNKIQIGNNSYEPHQVIENAQKAAGWFAAIALFSLINSVLVFLKTDVSFVVGLGVTLCVDAMTLGIREEFQDTTAMIITVIGIIINLAFIGLFLLFWRLSKRGSRTAYIIGMIVYFLDGLIFLLAQDWVGIAFHLFFLFMLWGGYQAIKHRKKAQQILEASSAVPTTIQPTC
jgi:hypothetical protein